MVRDGHRSVPYGPVWSRMHIILRARNGMTLHSYNNELTSIPFLYPSSPFNPFKYCSTPFNPVQPVTAIRYDLRGSSSKSHFTLVNNMENNNIIKSIWRLQLVNKGKLSNAEFFRALFKLFQRKEWVDFLLEVWRGKSVILCGLVCMV